LHQVSYTAPGYHLILHSPRLKRSTYYGEYKELILIQIDNI
jgi:hypothetical protein